MFLSSFIATVFLFPSLKELAEKLIDYLEFTQPSSDSPWLFFFWISSFTVFGLLCFVFHFNPESSLKSKIAMWLNGKFNYKGKYLHHYRFKILESFSEKLREGKTVKTRWLISISDLKAGRPSQIIEIQLLDGGGSQEITVSDPNFSNKYLIPWNIRNVLEHLIQTLTEYSSLTKIEEISSINFENINFYSLDAIDKLIEIEPQETDRQALYSYMIGEKNYQLSFDLDSCHLNGNSWREAINNAGGGSQVADTLFPPESSAISFDNTDGHKQKVNPADVFSYMDAQLPEHGGVNNSSPGTAQPEIDTPTPDLGQGV